MSVAPAHSIVLIDSSGSRMLALTMATKTSDIIKSPTRPGNRNFCAQKIAAEVGKTTMKEKLNIIGERSTIVETAGSATLPTKLANKRAKIQVKKI